MRHMFSHPLRTKAAMRRLVALIIVPLLSISSLGGAQRPEWVKEVLDAAQLPLAAAHARQAGVPDSAVRAAVAAMQNAKVRPGDAQEVLDEARREKSENGPVGNFGAVVQAKLQAGLRGRDLAAAIHAEHTAQRGDS